MRFEFLAILYGLACALPASPALPQAPPLPQSVAFVSADGKSLCPCHGRKDCTCAAGDCGCGSCGMVSDDPKGVHNTYTLGATYEWRSFSDDAGQVALFLDGRQVGGYSFVTGLYRPVDATGAWGSPTRCPAVPPVQRPEPRARQPLAPPPMDPDGVYFFQGASSAACSGGSCGPQQARRGRR